MTTNQIRKKFLDFFASKGHTIVESDSLVPKDDPTVLFTTAGMQQFKRQFLGHIDGYTKAVTSQKCLRTDDLSEVGQTDFHHTFFEMLGNFSFGDYFKKEAIAWAWEFLTKEMGIPEEKLWVSVYHKDSEAKDIWLENIQISKDKLVELGDKSNFWPANAIEDGPNGPCGSCSEIFYDYGTNSKCTSKTCDPECDCGRFCEIWNLVFTQFNRKEGGVLEALPSKNIDTGMGLERLASVLQGKRNNFEIDMFAPILESIDTHILEHGKYSIDLRNKRVMADHIRAVTIGINDGVMPSNEGRGYIMKKLIIDIADIALQASRQESNIHTLVPAVVEAMKEPYPELMDKMNDIAGMIKNVEQSYIKVRKHRIPELEKKLKELQQNFKKSDELVNELGQQMFIFKDTYGLTLATIENSMQTNGINEDLMKSASLKFEILMNKQQEQSRASSKMMGDVFTDMALDKIDIPKTLFLGYEHMQSIADILCIFVDNKQVQDVKQGDVVQIILDQTPFYAESGGQAADIGEIIFENSKICITDTQKQDDIYIHTGTVELGTFKVGNEVTVNVDIPRRLNIMRHHTATHMLQTALQKVLGTHVKQQGSLVAEDRLRFDFTHHKALTSDEIHQIEDFVNQCILSCDSVDKKVMSIEEARKSGALAFFAEKYGQTVRVISIGDYSKEFCGGTHLDSTGQMGVFKIIGESAIAQGIRRLEAKTGVYALEEIKNQEKQLEQIAQILKVPEAELIERVGTQVKRIKQLEKDLAQFRFEAIKEQVPAIIEKAGVLEEAKIITHCFMDVDMGLLRKVMDLLKKKVKSFVIVLGIKSTDSASILVAVSEGLIKKNIKANDIITELNPLINGSGGGRANLAQAGSKESSKVESAIEQAKEIIKNQFLIKL